MSAMVPLARPLPLRSITELYREEDCISWACLSKSLAIWESGQEVRADELD